VSEYLKSVGAKDTKELQQMGGSDALSTAAYKGDAKKVRELLAAGADVNHTKWGDAGKTALWFAAWQGHLEAAQALIDAGADVDKGRTTDGATSLTIAAFKGNLEVVKALVGAKANVNKAKNNGRTPLNRATYNNHTAVAEYLKSVGAHESRRGATAPPPAHP
jgi:cytohesin